MKHIAGWLRRNSTLMAQVVGSRRQLQEAWDANKQLEDAIVSCDRTYTNILKQLHRVARERDKERGLTIKHAGTIMAQQIEIDKERELRLAAEELREHYLENEEE